MTHDPREALKVAIGHIEHMAAWITATKIDTYSFESLGEDMPWLREALTTSAPKGKPCAYADWGQIVQSLLRTMDHPHKGENSSVQAERMATELCRKYPSPPPAAGWDEAKTRRMFETEFASMDLTEDKDAWGQPKFKHSHVDAIYEGWRRAVAALRREAPASSSRAADRLGSWMSAALVDSNTCSEMKADIEGWFAAGMPCPVAVGDEAKKSEGGTFTNCASCDMPRTCLDHGRCFGPSDPPDRREIVALAFQSGDSTPDVKPGNYKSFIVVIENKEGRRFAFAAYYLNAYPLQYGDCCPKGDGCQGEGCDDGCPTTGWFEDRSNFEYDDCFYPLSGKVLWWAPIPKADAILAALDGGAGA